MAAPTENLLSLGDFVKQMEHCAKKSVNRPVKFQDRFSTMNQGQLREMHLQQQWQELKERELIAQQHNRQLLQQFEEAQDTLREMLARNAAMKTIRMEYERYLEKNFPCWQQQLQEKTLMAEKKKMEDYLMSCLKKTEQEPASKSSAGISIRPHKNIPQAYSTQESFDYNQDGSSQHPYIQSSWLTQTQSQAGRFPVRLPAQTHNPTILSPPNFQHPQSFIHPFASMRGHPHSQSRQDTVYWGPSEHNYPWPWPAGIPPGSWGQFCTEELPFESRVSQTGKQEEKLSRATSSKWIRGGGSSCSRLSPELDVKPVRLPSAHTESSETVRDSSVTSSREKRKKREKRERTKHSSSDSERCGCQETSGEIVIASVKLPQSSAAETSTEEEHTRSSRRSKRSEGLTAPPLKLENATKEETKNHSKESQSASSSEESMKEKAGNQSHENTESCREEQESGSNSVKNKNRFLVEIEKQENSSSEQSRAEENEEEERRKSPGAGENDIKEDSDEENDDNEVSAKINTTDEDVETAGEDEDEIGDDEESNKLKTDPEIRRQGSASSQDEDEGGSDGSEGKMKKDEGGSDEEEDGESEEEEEHRNDQGEEENRDSEDSIISPQEKRPQQMQIIFEDGAEDDDNDDDNCKEGSSNEDLNEVSDEDDVENLLAPHDQSKTEDKNEKADGNPKAICHSMDIFQVTDVGSKTDHLGDSDESDHFYD